MRGMTEHTDHIEDYIFLTVQQNDRNPHDTSSLFHSVHHSQQSIYPVNFSFCPQIEFELMHASLLVLNRGLLCYFHQMKKVFCIWQSIFYRNLQPPYRL